MYTDLAWALLCEEMVRRGLPSTAVGQGLEKAKEVSAEKSPVVLPLSRWGEVPDKGTHDVAPPKVDQRHQAYRLGRLFAVLHVVFLFANVNLFAHDSIRDIDIYLVACYGHRGPSLRTSRRGGGGGCSSRYH